jgi:hypothetical protein
VDDKNTKCRVDEGIDTSNEAIKAFLIKRVKKDNMDEYIDWNDLKILPIEKREISIENTILLICYQQEEEHYHARSFEDAFIHINKNFIKSEIDDFKGLKNKELFKADGKDTYVLAEKCIEKKTHFALDILYHSDENFSNWKIPAYIKNGLLWLKRD